MMHVAAYLLPVRHRHLEALTRRLCNDRDAVLSRREIDEVRDDGLVGKVVASAADGRVNENNRDGRSALGCELGDEVARTPGAGSECDDEGPPWSAHLRCRDQTRSVSVPDDRLADTRKPRGCPQPCPRLNIAEVGLVDAGVSEAKIGFR